MKKKQVFTTLFVLFFKGTIFFKEKRLNISEAYRKQSSVHATVSFQRILIFQKRAKHAKLLGPPMNYKAGDANIFHLRKNRLLPSATITFGG